MVCSFTNIAIRKKVQNKQKAEDRIRNLLPKGLILKKCLLCSNLSQKKAK